MPEPIEGQVADAPEQTARQTLEDGLVAGASEEAAEPGTEETGEVSEEAAAIAGGVKPGEEETAEATDEVEETLREQPEDGVTPGVQKRIDRLTAEKKALEERLGKLEAQQNQAAGKTPKYSEAQLKVALKKALDDGDADLAFEIISHINKQSKDELVEMYENEKKQYMEASRQISAEWDETLNAYSKYADTKIPEIWPNSHADLNVREATSLLYQVAMKLYSDPALPQYRKPGGQRMAVADALTKIFVWKAGSRGKDSEKERLKRQLMKEKKKKSIVSGGATGEDETGPARLMSDNERLEEVISERKKFQLERGK